ncbi:MAG: phosphatase PAP2 family protein [Chloroflexi bacterium]|nr:phosphatase PAP2 family protein [Chloroflexota bacterium]
MMQRFSSQALRPTPVAAAWLALAGFTALLAAYVAAFSYSTWEVELTRGIQAASPGALDHVAEFMTFIGRSPISTVLPAIAIAALWLSGQRRLSGFLALTALARLIAPIVKVLVDRPRPAAALVDVANQLSSPSFPSGHVLGATLFYGFLIYCAEYAIPNRRTLRRTIQGGLALIIVLMAYARVQLGEHWPTDVLGGFALGLLILALIIGLHRLLGRPGHEERLAPAPAKS